MPASCHSFLHLCCSVLWLLPREKSCSITSLASLIQQSLVLSHDVLAPLRLLCGLGGVWGCITTSHLVTSQVLWASRAVRLLHLVFYLKSNILNLILCLFRHWGLMCFWIMNLLLSMSKKISISITIWNGISQVCMNAAEVSYWFCSLPWAPPCHCQNVTVNTSRLIRQTGISYAVSVLFVTEALCCWALVDSLTCFEFWTLLNQCAFS